PCAVIAPEIVVVDRIEPVVDRNHAGPSCIQRDGFDRAAVHTSGLDGPACGQRQCIHVVGVALGRVVRIFFLAKQRVVGGGAAKAASFAVEDGDSNAQRSKVYACYGAHKASTTGDSLPSSPNTGTWLPERLQRRWTCWRQHGARIRSRRCSAG